MASSAFVYGLALDHFLDADIDWTADTIKVALSTDVDTPVQDFTDDFFNDLTSEVVGTGYTADGATLASPTRTYTAGTNTLALDAADSTWTTSFTSRYGIVYKDRGGAQTADELICYHDWGGNFTVSAGTFTITWAAAGIITLTAA